MFMPYVLTFNRPAIEARIGRLAAYLGLEPTFDAFLAWVLDLRARIGVPHTLAGLGVDGARLDLMSRMAPKDPTAGGNPVPIDEAACRRLYEDALAGRVQ
jgi:alcohol dehydrogenase